MIQVWGRRNSFNVQKVMWALGEIGLDFDHIDAGGPFGLLDEDWYREMNPNRLVPTLKDGKLTIWESHAILRYLAAKYSAGSLWPEDPGARSQADRWIDWTQSSLGSAFMQLFWMGYRTPVADQKPQIIAQAKARTDALLSLLNDHLAGQTYVAGDGLTMGDIPAGCCLYRYFEMDLDRPSLPHVEAWYARLTERPAYREHVMVPFDDLKGRLAF